MMEQYQFQQLSERMVLKPQLGLFQAVYQPPLQPRTHLKPHMGRARVAVPELRPRPVEQPVREPLPLMGAKLPPH